MTPSAVAAPVLPLPTTYTPSANPSYGSLASSAPVATTTSRSAPSTSANMRPSRTVVATSAAGPRYVGSLLNVRISQSATGVNSSAPEPKPAMVMPDARPRRSGNHRISACTGGVYARPTPTPPSRPYPAYSSGRLCMDTPSPPRAMPPPKQAAATDMATRGPTRICHLPIRAAEMPCIANTMLSGIVADDRDQSSAADVTKPYSRVSGPLTTDQAYGLPMQRCVANAGTTIAHRLVNDGLASTLCLPNTRSSQPRAAASCPPAPPA
mmetsp:Transcript_17108/g.54948  ORF Transcript_17108/g.54948 Transcript_17108/m.54948 type:complete len:267 (-) Transcript_17108:219-1019(-)